MIPERIVGSVGPYLLIEKRTYLGYPRCVGETSNAAHKRRTSPCRGLFVSI
jgi:hypothetical protein